MKNKSAHPSATQLRAFGLGQLAPEDSKLIEQHVETCEACCRVLQDIPDDPMLVKLKRSGSVAATEIGDIVPITGSSMSADIPQALLDNPRYRIVKVLGRGGMGTVYKAEHRLMERLVALKVINPQMCASQADSVD